ncbi:MAG: Zn-dependent alcohol dehydrogenase [Fimbriimonadaceae bacterium]|nr:Zn-dependent alcohol dehydrogenase [Fimbriimonadaceae bacterium]
MVVRAAVLEAVGRAFEVQELDLAEPQAGEVLVRMAATGVCHSDWHLVTGDTRHPTPCVPGHEGAGVVERVGPGVATLSAGDPVALNWAPSCGHCFYCQAGRPSLCEAYTGPIWAGTMLDGTTRFSRRGCPIYHYSALACFAERVVVPWQCCVPMPGAVPLPVAALIGCAVTTGVGAVLNTARVPAGASAAVFGVGGVGLSTVMGLVLAGAATIVAVDRHDSRLDQATAFGATHRLRSGPDTNEALRRLTGGRGPDYVFEAVGSPALQEQALDAVRPGGTVVLSGISPVGSATNLPGAVLVRQEKTVMGSYYGTADAARDFPLYAGHYLAGRLPLDQLVSRTYSLDEINVAYQDMLQGRVARGVVVF